MTYGRSHDSKNSKSPVRAAMTSIFTSHIAIANLLTLALPPIGGAAGGKISGTL